MKIVRYFFILISGSMLFFSCMLLYISGITQELFSSDMSSAIIENIDITAPLQKALANMPNGERMEGYVDKQVKDVKKAFMDNEDFNQFIQTYSMDVLNSLANADAPLPDIDQDVRNIIDKHETDVKKALGNKFNDSQKDALIQGMKNNIHLTDAYTHIVEAAKERLTPQQVFMTKVINIFTKPFTKTLSYLLMGFSILLILIMKRSLYAWLLPVGVPYLLAGGALFISSKIIGKLLTSGYSVTANLISEQSQRMATYAYWYLGIGVFVCILYIIGKCLFAKVYKQV